jgi:hypothetical protein
VDGTVEVSKGPILYRIVAIPQKAQFVEVQIKAAEPLREIGILQQAKAIEVRLCGGRSIAVEPGFDAD